MVDEIRDQARTAIMELLKVANLQEEDIVVVGCSSSEVGGHAIGTESSTDIADAIFAGIYPVLQERGLFLAAQCCEHLNRALIVEREAARRCGLEIVNVVPQPKAGGSFATAAYKNFENPVAVETITARAGLDIGGTLIGMHRAPVAVPVRISVTKIGMANLICARTRPRFIGGGRAQYDDSLL